MDRLVHHEIRAANSTLLAGTVTLAVTAVVQGFPAADWDWRFVGATAGFLVLWTLLRATRVKGLGSHREFEKAVPLEENGRVPPADVPLRRDHPVSGRLLFLYVVLTLPVALLWEPWVTVVCPGSAIAWLGDAAVAAHWERRHGLVLWRGHVRGSPWELSVSPRPATRTATGAPPGSPTPPAAPEVPEEPPRTTPPTT
jgi:hypothetical protein